jgi:hypothetical protein
MGLDQTVRDLETKLAQVEKELSDLKNNEIKELRSDSIQTLRDLPGTLLAAESTMLDKQSRNLTLALNQQNRDLTLEFQKQNTELDKRNKFLTIAGLVFTALTFVIGFIFTGLVQKQLSDFDQKLREARELRDDLRDYPDLAYKKLRNEEVVFTLNYVKSNPDQLAAFYFLFEATEKLPAEAFNILRKIVIDSKFPGGASFTLMLKKFHRQIATREDPQLIDALSKASFFNDLTKIDDTGAVSIIRNFSSHLPSQSSEKLLKKFLESYLSGITINGDGTRPPSTAAT